MLFLDEATNCRQQAAAYKGKPEAPFLLKVADAFEELAHAEFSARTLPTIHVAPSHRETLA